jgi:regulator of extracellular matrix RemA (YlzA/DUF370 family)
MFLHLGGDFSTKLKNIIAIVNAENALGASTNREFLKTAEEEGFIQAIDHDNVKSIIITDKKVYLSPISSHTLKKRANFIHELE